MEKTDPKVGASAFIVRTKIAIVFLFILLNKTDFNKTTSTKRCCEVILFGH